MASYDFDGERYERASAHQRAWGGDLMSLYVLYRRSCASQIWSAFRI